MKRIFLYGLVSSLLIIAGCHSSTTDSVKTAEKENNDNADSLRKKQSVTDSSTAIPSKQDADFIVKAASGGMLEVELGKLAQSHAARQGVKDFGALMVQDHSKGGEALLSLAMAKKVVLPDSVSNDQKKERNNLMKKHGLAFDRSYISLMVQDHKDDIAEFQHAARDRQTHRRDERRPRKPGDERPDPVLRSDG